MGWLVGWTFVVGLTLGLTPGRGVADDPAICPAPLQPMAAEAFPQPPQELFGELFADVQLAELFEDQKTFADSAPKQAPAAIVRDYASAKDQPGFDLKAFVLERFTLPPAEGVMPPEGLSLVDHIDWLWPRLTRTTTTLVEGDSLLPLPEPYIVPGGRYQELYYWDSYFTMVGLVEAGREDLVRSMIEDFAYEIDRYGHIPNGSRTYYLSRSQPPFFSSMIELAVGFDGARVREHYLRQLRCEHAFWMAGASDTTPGSAFRRVVRLPDGTILNRYWDDRDTPRDESYAYASRPREKRRTGPRARCTASCVPPPRAAGTSARAGSPTG